MPEVLTLERTLPLIRELVAKEKSLDSKSKTRITIKGEVSAVETPRNDGKYQDVYLRQETTTKPLFLKVTRFDLKTSQPLTEADIGKELTFTGTASEYKGEFSLFGVLGDGTRSQSGGQGRQYNPRLAIVIALTRAGQVTLEAIEDGSFEETVDKLEAIARGKSQKSASKPAEEEQPEDPFDRG